MSRRFVSDHADRYPVTRLCVLIDVARSTYYQWRDRPPSRRDLDDAVLVEAIVDIHQASQRTYGRHGFTARSGTAATGWVLSESRA